MKKSIWGYLSAVAVLLSTGPFAPALGQGQVTRVQSVEVGAEPQVIDSWMQPTHVRTREIVRADGTSERMVEPIIQERHEAVMYPVGRRTETTYSEYSPQVTKTITHAAVIPKTRVVHHRRHIVHRMKHRYIAAAPRRRFIAQRVQVTQPARRTFERHETLEQHAVIIERKDPALDLY